MQTGLIFDSTSVGAMPTMFKVVFFPLAISPLLQVDIAVQEGQRWVSERPGNAVPPAVRGAAPKLSRQCRAGWLFLHSYCCNYFKILGHFC